MKTQKKSMKIFYFFLLFLTNRSSHVSSGTSRDWLYTIVTNHFIITAENILILFCMYSDFVELLTHQLFDDDFNLISYFFYSTDYVNQHVVFLMNAISSAR
jgi:hypothetical protein